MVAESNIRETECHIGARIELNGYYGSIKYIGPLEGYPGKWLGIDWDDPTRGKHNGMIKGVQYFETRHPKSGSCLRQEVVNFGQPAISSILSRYHNSEDSNIYEEELKSFQKSINAPFLQLVGFDKVADRLSNFESLQIVNLRLQNVNSPGRPMELKNLCPNIRELDISKNLLSSWLDIFDICSQLEHLHWINVSENYLTLPDNYSDFIFPNIKTLICGYMNLKWSDVLKLSTVFPNVEELRVPYNDITVLCIPKNTTLINLKMLDLEGNSIEHWSEIMKLSIIGTLQQLNLENINLKSIEIDKTDNIFINLIKINLSNNDIMNWKSVGELDKLPCLEEVRLMRNPFLDLTDLETRDQMITARLKNLKVLNGRVISAEERRGAEYDYIKRHGLEWLKVKGSPDEQSFLSEHNRYLELIQTYGSLEESELTVQSHILQSSLITLKLVHEDRIILKKVPPTIAVQKLVMLAGKLFKLSDRPRLKYISGAKSEIEVDLDDDVKELGYYSVQEGDIIKVLI
ncbi:tubulin-specific chaperone E isoform X2 [Aethina tumida]|nr:tubulin-specific chaperone E isoform X2 [Aethina tumida]